MNKICIAGRIVKDPELRTTNSGTEVCGFTVAVDRRIKSGDEKITDFIDCTAWGKTGVFVSTYFHKGDGINLDGRMESRKWADKDGNNRVSWGVTCDNVEFPHGKARAYDSANSAAQNGAAGGGGADGFTDVTDLGDLPF